MTDVGNIRVDWLGVRPGSTVLDVGCGRGEHARAFAQLGCDVVAVDASLWNVPDDVRRSSQCGTLTAVRADLDQGLPFSAGAFDAVICIEVLEHVERHRLLVADIARVCRAGGRVCIAVPTAASEALFHRVLPTYVEDSRHLNVFTRALLEAELRVAGFTIDRVATRNFEWSVFWLMHAIRRSRFDVTGSPLGHPRTTATFWFARRLLRRARVERALIAFGNHVLPKSYYVYATRRGEGP